jgi:hypothetical protein
MKLTILKNSFSTMSLLVLGMTVAACSGMFPVPIETPTLFHTTTPTATTVWFPPTDTPTFLPTQIPSPTLEYHPGLDGLVFSDTFDDPQMWNTASSAQASATLTRSRLVLSITGTGPLSIISLRNQPEVSDFYAESMADISLCSNKDQYGMIFRASSGRDFYRFSINCNSQERVERVRGGETYPLIEWMTSGDAPSGAPAQIKLGVWMAGREMRFFLNDHFQFSLVDPVFSSGTIGFFVYANGQTPVTVSFSDLSVYSVNYTPPTPTQLPPQTEISSPSPNP